MRKLTILFVTITLLASGCYKDTDNSTVVKKKRPPHIVVNANLFGTYVSENEKVSSLLLKIGDDMVEATDGQLPVIALSGVQKRGEFIELYSDGNRAGAAQIALIENDINYTNIIVSNSFEKTELEGGESIVLHEGISVSFVDALFTTTNGTAYGGSAVAEHDFSEDNAYNSQLATFAYDRTGTLSVLDIESSFFVGAVAEDDSELGLEAGELLINSDYGDDLELFYYRKEERAWEWVSDFTTGINAQKIQNLGWFVIAESTPALYIEGKIELAATEVVNQKVQVESGTYSKEVYSTSAGRIGGFIPLESSLQVNVINRSGQAFFQQEYSANAKLSSIVISIPSEEANKNFLKSDFQVIDCDGNIAEDRIVSLEYDQASPEKFALNDGESSWIPVSEERFTIKSGDGPEFSWASDGREVHYLSSCSDHKEGFSLIKIRGDQKVFPAFQQSTSAGKILLKSSQDEIRFLIEADSKGVYGSEKTNISINDERFGSQGYKVACENAADGCGLEICEITHYKPDGDEWNRIYFRGVVWMQTIAPPLSGNFEVEGYILSKQ